MELTTFELILEAVASVLSVAVVLIAAYVTVIIRRKRKEIIPLGYKDLCLWLELLAVAFSFVILHRIIVFLTYAGFMERTWLESGFLILFYVTMFAFSLSVWRVLSKSVKMQFGSF
jgi:hypothetical protein